MADEKAALLARIRDSAETHKRLNDEGGYTMPKGAIIHGLTYPEAMLLLDLPPGSIGGSDG